MNLSGFHQLSKKGNIGIIIGFKTHFPLNEINFVAEMVPLSPQGVFEFKTARFADGYFHLGQRTVRELAIGLGKIAVMRADNPYRNQRRC